jgi:purine-nucleoside phosphorylase
MTDIYSNAQSAADYIRTATDLAPHIGIILGSGLGNFANHVRGATRIPYAEIPHFPRSTVEGHSGHLVLGTIAGVPIAVMQGRVHAYEGYPLSEVTFPTRVLGLIGCKTLIVTNAAGGINTKYKAGDLMVISDHINLMGSNPLRGPNLDELGVRFPDMSEAYPASLRELAKDVARELGQLLQEGVYLALSGPTYETPAEIRAFRTLGADAVGMSTVPEVIAMSQMGIPVLGISCITNMAAGILNQKLTHQEVMETTARVQNDFTALVLGCLQRLGS